ncbi:MAG: pitrilysin family protein [Pseudomonadota bacterium]
MVRSLVWLGAVVCTMAITACEALEAISAPEETALAETVTLTDRPVETSADPAIAEGLLPYEKFELENGLDVIFHIDRSDPVVAVSITAHVGSSREKPGRTGFAHLFEHLLFLESENLGKGGLDKLSARIGGSGANGFTSRDQTTYLQTVPKNALEKMLWAEADKLGWFINTVTDPVLAKEKQVVKNEKRQWVDNRPYGHMFSVLRSNLYPEDHPYNWEVIGSLEDLQAATLNDVKDFYGDWYTPNNVTLVVAGDFDPGDAKAWVHRYFDEIPRGADIARQEPRAAVLEASKSFVHEDNFAEQPRLAMVWPTVPEYHPDSYALDVLAALLTEGKRAPLNQVLIDEAKLTAEVDGFIMPNELSGEFMIIVTAFEGTDLDDVKGALTDGLARFEANGVSEDALSRVKIDQEVQFYSALQNVLGKGTSLAEYSIFAGDPGFVDQDLANLQAVTAEDVVRVYEAYIKDKPFVAGSFVPKGASELALEGAVIADVVEEQVIAGAEDAFDPSIEATYERTPSEIDRSVEPPAGATPVLATPAIWETKLANGLKVLGIEDSELPLVEFRLSIDGGHLRDTIEKNGVANLVAEMMTRGTELKTAAEFDEALAALGAEMTVQADDEALIVSGTSLARNFDQVMVLLEEMMLQPRWDEAEFELAKSAALNQVIAQKAAPNALAQFSTLYVLYGADDIRAHGALGSEASIPTITLEDLQAFYGNYIVSNLSSFRIVGDVEQEAVLAALSGLEGAWGTSEVEAPNAQPAELPETAGVYFYDVPGAKQSVFNFGHPALLRTDDAYYPANVANYILGGGSFASRLTQELREGKGYTYGIFSFFDSTARNGTFRIFSQIRSNVTLEAVQLVRQIATDYADTLTEADLATTKSFFLNSKAREFESFNAKLALLRDVDLYGLPYDYVAEETAIVEAMTLERLKELAATHIRPDSMSYVIVGDAETQLDRLEELGLGPATILNREIDAIITGAVKQWARKRPPDRTRCKPDLAPREPPR